MSIDLTSLDNHHDLLFEVALKVRQGHRFQPTGFPDLGAAEFDTPNGRSLLVESAQSMANRLEAVCWDESANNLIEPLRGLSYVKVTRDDGQNTEEGNFLTSSVLEAHRLNSPYIEKAKPGIHQQIKQEIGVGKSGPIDRPKFVKTVFKYDAGSLVHGVFLESMDGRLRIARAISAFIEADGVKTAASGGVKNDRVQPSKDEAGGRTASEGFGNLPFPRDEYTAEKITLYASIDLAQIRGYGLEADATKMLILLALFKLRAFVDSPMRLRTACSFEVKDVGAIASKNVNDFRLPERKDMVGEMEENGKWSGELPTLIGRLAVAKDDQPENVEKMRVTPVFFTA
ncbi:MAG: type I-U CRISPR-associated RAMP protein Csb1/Cas7u [Thermoleophilia bacterium]|nr:type I-U CRISPR-associated RAMP protein Csb1/Cas7u [Thermoleophilia bacterium]